MFLKPDFGCFKDNINPSEFKVQDTAVENKKKRGKNINLRIIWTVISENKHMRKSEKSKRQENKCPSLFPNQTEENQLLFFSLFFPFQLHLNKKTIRLFSLFLSLPITHLVKCFFGTANQEEHYTKIPQTDSICSKSKSTKLEVV